MSQYSNRAFLRPRQDDSRHSIRLQKIIQILLDDASAAARCVSYKNPVAIEDNDPAMKYVQVLAG